MRLSRAFLPVPLFLALGLVRCSDDPAPAGPGPSAGSGGASAGNAGSSQAGQAGAGGTGGQGGTAGSGGGACVFPDCWVPGDANGHADPAGAKAAKQARAGRITDVSLLKQPVDVRARARLGDFLLVNDKIAIIVEDKGLSDGYSRFGGDILTVDGVGEDGKPLGLSQYGETLFGLSNEMINPSSVTVLNDGSDGKAAIVRVMGKLEQVPFFGGLASFFPNKYGFQAIYDYILEPGSEKLRIRLGVINDSGEDKVVKPADEMHGFFHFSRSQIVTPGRGYDDPKGKSDWVAFDSYDGKWGFAWRSPRGQLSQAVDISGFRYFSGSGFPLPQNVPTFVEYAELVSAGPGLDGIREGMARAFKTEKEGAALTGIVQSSSGVPVPGAFVHLVGPDGSYLSRTRADSAGAFTIHSTGGGSLVAQARGWGLTAPVAEVAGPLTLAFAPEARLHVTARSLEGDEALPVRVQVIPVVAPPATPASYGREDEASGRLHQEFVLDGDETLVVPPGSHRVIVSRGYEWELLDTTVTAEAGKTTEVAAKLAHSVETKDVLCGDFHIHSNFSADAEDPVEYKVKGALADGLDVAVSSEHDWIVDFNPVIAGLGMSKWAFGMPSQELTTFTIGHFGVLPLRPNPDAVNNGAFDWIGKNMEQIFDEVHGVADKPLIIVNHPSDGLANQGYFASAGFNRATGKGADGKWSDHFDALEVFNSSDYDANEKKSVADYFALLKSGKTAVMVGSSDSHHLRSSPVGYPRTCMRFGHDDPQKLSPELVRDAVAAGSSTISGGLYLEVKGPGGELPGATVTTAAGKATFTLRVAAPSWVSADTIDAVVDGVPLATPEKLVPVAGHPGPGKLFEQTLTVSIDPATPRHFVVFVARGEKDKDLSPLHPSKKPFAVSNPYFLK